MKNLGCFHNGPPFHHPINRPVSFLPEDRELISTKFSLYTSLDPQYKQILVADHPETLVRSNFNWRWPTKIIVHGFMDSSFFTTWMQRMKDEFLINGFYNVILVDWPIGAFLFFRKAVANCRVVGAEIAFLIQRLRDIKGAPPESFHIIAPSLGAHIAGYVGKRIKNLGRITGLDVGSPYFREVSPRVRLDSQDAILVDNIHSNAGENFLQGLGSKEAVGHLDFFPNNGNHHPGCEIFSKEKVWRNFYEFLVNIILCSHLRSIEFFIASIKYPDCFVGVPCSNYNDFSKGKCTCTQDNPCYSMGLHAEKPFTTYTSRILYLKTSSQYPYCLFQYQIVLELEWLRNGVEYGEFLMVIQDFSDEKETSYSLNQENAYYPNVTYTFLMAIKKRLAPIKDVWLSWQRIKHPFLNEGLVKIKYLKVTPITVLDERSPWKKWCGGSTLLHLDHFALLPRIPCSYIG